MHVARAVAALRPCLVVIENVRGLLTSPAGSPGDVEPCPLCLGDTAGQPALRALGAVLGSLADLGYDAKWLVLRASDVGARTATSGPSSPHGPPDTLLKTPTSNIGKNGGSQHPSKRKSGGHGPNLADEVEWLLPTPKASDGIKGSPGQRHGNGDGDITLPSAAAPLLPTPRASDTGTPGRRPGKWWRPPLSAMVLPLWKEEFAERTGDGGPYASAITRWESLTRPAPEPTDAAGRLRADFVEWMQGLDDGWVTATPGLGRPAQLTALGNGVVPQQATRALQLLAPPFPRCPRCAGE
ncbi:hypothetical protein ACWGN0_10545 [Streptomyces rubiginosohelvolus]